MTNTPNTQDNALITVEVQPPVYNKNATFDQLAQDIPLIVERAHQILDQVDEDNLDQMNEDEILEVVKDMKEVKPYFKKVKDARDDVQRILKANVTSQMASLDKDLQKTGVAELAVLIDKANDLQRRITAARKTKRWAELQSKFNQTIAEYPLLATHVPNQIDFKKFKDANPKLISGAKNANVSASMINTLTNYISTLESDVESILNFKSEFQDQLFTQYQLTPDLPQIIKLNRALEDKEKARKAAEEKAIQERIQREVEAKAAQQAQEILTKERKRQADEANAAIEAAKNATPKDGAQPQVIVKTVEVQQLTKSELDISKESRKDLAGSPFSETLESYLMNKYPDLSNDNLRFDAIFNVISAIGNQDPDIMRFVKNATHALDAVKLLLMSK